MRRILSIALPILLVSICGCGEIRESWDASAEAARAVHRGDAQALCGRFSEAMLSALPCDATERVLRQTVAAVGEPVGECHWGYTYRIQTLDPLHSVAIYKCPFARETVKVTVAIQVTDSGTEISGLWTDSSRIRTNPLLIRFELCRKINEAKNACVGPISTTAWDEPRIAVWNQWQNLRGGDEIAWSWLAPDGGDVTRLVHQVEESPPPRLPDLVVRRSRAAGAGEPLRHLDREARAERRAEGRARLRGGSRRSRRLLARTSHRAAPGSCRLKSPIRYWPHAV